MKINSIGSTSFKGMLVGKTTEGKQVAIKPYEIDQIEPLNEKTTICKKYSYEEKNISLSLLLMPRWMLS